MFRENAKIAGCPIFGESGGRDGNVWEKKEVQEVTTTWPGMRG